MLPIFNLFKALTSLSVPMQASYFENHKAMPAVDKRHKLYSSTLEPVVWARSVALEVVNELDAVKAGCMMDAGGGRTMGSGCQWMGVEFACVGCGGTWYWVTCCENVEGEHEVLWVVP